MSDYMSAHLAPAGFGMSIPDIQVEISHRDNGYTVTYVEIPKPPPPPPPEEMPAPPDPDEMMDAMLDGLGALLHHIQDRTAGGEEWKGSEDREKLRKGFRVMFPNLEQQIRRQYEPPQRPIMKSLVFETREKLMAFLAASLPEDRR